MEPENLAENLVRVSGLLSERLALRWTPAKVPVVGFVIEHQSKQLEAGIEREVSFQMQACVLGELAHQINILPLGSAIRVEGFLAAKSIRYKTPVLHVTKIELLEGMNHGFQTS